MRYFGTDGVRGTANLPPITPAWVLRLATVAARVARGRGYQGPVVLGRDPRRSGEALAAAAAAGFAGAGLEVLDAGVVPTPAVSFLVRRLGGSLGAVLSASHNPAEENGIKFFGPDGGKLDPALEACIESALAEGVEEAGPTGPDIGRVRLFPRGERMYVDELVTRFGPRLDLDGVDVVVDAANGAAHRTAPGVLRKLGARVHKVACRPDGMNINKGCGALHPERLRRAVEKHGAAFGLAHDGDADRVLLVDEGGGVLDGDDLLFVLACARRPRPRAVVGTIMSNEGLALGLREQDIDLLRAPVGDRNVKAWMDQNDAPVGAEPSGHVILPAHGPTGDGLAAGLEALVAAEVPRRSLSAVRAAWARLPQELVNVQVARKPPLDEVPGYPELLQEVEAALAGSGRVLVRYSGTERKVRVMVEALDADRAREAAGTLARHLERSLA